MLTTLYNVLGTRQVPNGPPPNNSPLPTTTAQSNGPSAVVIVVPIVIVVLLTMGIFGCMCLRRLRANDRSPKYVPTSYLKKKWQEWTPRNKYSTVGSRDRRSHDRNLSADTSYNAGNQVEEAAATNAVTAGVDRNTSVRSVMTLPPYSLAPKETEQVIGREGERGGMDTVVEFPETNDEEETRREDQMESLYQIRLARRREIAEREERRRLRREARERGDATRLEQLRRESRARATASRDALVAASREDVSSAALIAEHQSRGRERKVSAVSYADVGHVRHDGTRLRADSGDSQRQGLLDDAESMGEVGGRNRGLSDAASATSHLTQPHNRTRSGSSALSITTMASDDDQAPGQNTPPSTQPEARRNASFEGTTSDSTSSPIVNRYTPEDSTGSDDVSNVRIDDQEDLPEPPEYDYSDWGDAPDYETAMRRASTRRANARISRTSIHLPRLPSIHPESSNIELPHITVHGATEPNTPISPLRDEERVVRDAHGL